MAKVERCISETMRDKVVVQRFLDREGARGCTKVVVRLGTGIELWNKAGMMMYREDPFETHTDIESWVKNMNRVHVPRLIRVMNS